MKERILNQLALLAERKPRTMFIVAIIITLVCGGLAGKLELKMNFKDLMPQFDPTVKEYDNIVENYNAASNIIIGAQGKEEELKKFTEELAPKIKNLKGYVNRVDYKLNKEFFKKHALMLTKETDLKNSKQMYEDISLLPLIIAINNNFEKTYITKGENSISTKEKENKAIASLNGVAQWIKTIDTYVKHGDVVDDFVVQNGVEKLLIGEEYMLSQNKNMILLFVKPTFPSSDLEKSTYLIHTLEDIISETKSHYRSIKFAGTAGTMALVVQETDSASSDMMYTSLISFVLIIALFIISFRMWSAPILAGISLIMGVMWTAGFAAITVGSLNMMTSMFAVILIGLGIDFNIHVISAYNENRANGETIKESIKLAFLKSGSGILIGAVTTALAFLTMLISSNVGMKEFALIAGFGVLFTMLASMFVLPSMLIIRDKIKVKKAEKIKQKLINHNNTNQILQNKLEDKAGKLLSTKTIRFEFMGQLANNISHKPILYLSIVLTLTVLLIYSATKITFNYDYLSLEPEGLSSIAVQDSMIKHFDATSDMVMVTSPSVEHARKIANKAKKLKKSGIVQSISEYIPSNKEYEKRLPYIKEIKQSLEAYSYKPSVSQKNIELLIDELYRLEDNIIELGQLAFMGGQDKLDQKVKDIVGNLDVTPDKRVCLIKDLVKSISINYNISVENINLFEQAYVPLFHKMAMGMTSVEKLNSNNLPEDIYDQFASKNGKNFLVTIYPKEQAWNFEFLSIFSKQMHSIDNRVTGMPLVFYILIKYIGKDGSIAAILTLIVVSLLLALDFKNLKLVVLTMIPLFFGTLWMIGIMQLSGMQLNIINVMAVPLILGIGIDDGVHIIHRYKQEGINNLSVVFSSTGKAVLITSLTTFLAFGSLGFATAKGLASLGITLGIGIITCYINTVVVLPALIGLLDKKDRVR